MKRLLLILLLITACSSQIKFVEINDIKIPVELASTDAQKAQGLMYRTNLTGGMLFVYSDEAARNFWMKNTLIPLDMIFISKEMKVTKIHHAVPCTKDPCVIYSANKAQYILEVNGNFTSENSIKEGSSVSFLK